MRTALVLGGGKELDDDIRSVRALGLEYQGVVACNDAGYHWPGDLDAWVSLHPEHFSRWAEKRRAMGYPEPTEYVSFREPPVHRKQWVLDRITDHLFPGCEKSGSSGLFAIKVALMDLGFDRVVLCGIPMTMEGAHFFNRNEPWNSAPNFRRWWQEIPQEYRDRMRSMSGWTKVFLGYPEWRNS